MRNKPTVHELMRMGMTAYLGPLNGERAKLDYVNFYAHLHRVVDAQIGRLLDALGDPADPQSLRSRTVIFRCADHGEMGLSHGGLRQKAFNAYEETIHVPLVISNPLLFPKPAETDALASLIDLCRRSPTSRGCRRPAARSAVVTFPRPRRATRPEGDRLARPHRPRSDRCAIPRPRRRPRRRSTSPLTITRRRPRSRTCPGSRTESARHEPRRESSRSTSIPRERRRPSTSSTTSSATRRGHNLVDRISGEPLDSSDRRMRLELGERLDSADVSQRHHASGALTPGPHSDDTSALARGTRDC